MKNEIDIKEDLKHQKKAWRIRYISFFVIIFLIIITALGLFGSGLLSGTVEGKVEDGFYLETEKFVRAGAAAEMLIHIKSYLVKNDTIELSLNNDFIKNIKIENIIPQPAEELTAGNNILFRFLFKEADAYLIKIIYTPKNAFSHFIDLKLNNDRAIKFNQIIYP